MGCQRRIIVNGITGRCRASLSNITVMSSLLRPQEYGVACFVFLSRAYSCNTASICRKERRPARSLLCNERVILLCRKRRVVLLTT